MAASKETDDLYRINYLRLYWSTYCAGSKRIECKCHQVIACILWGILVCHFCFSSASRDLFSGNKTVGIFILLGFILQIILEFFSQGIEHGHTHIHNKAIPISMLISLAIHAYLEGMPLADVDAHGHTHHFQDSLLTGIAIHKIPVTIVLMSLFAQAGYSKIKSFGFIAIFAVMAPLGTLSGNLIQELSLYNKEIMAIVVGIFLHISTTILFESSEGHKFNIQKLLVIGLGSILAWMI